MQSFFAISLSVVTAVIELVSGNSEVKTMNSTYPCCDLRSIRFDHHCDNLLSHDNVLFALYQENGSQKGCIAPCREIEDGRMVLEQCVEVQVSTVCKTGMDKIHERRTSFKGIPCSGSGLAPGSVGLLLLLLVAVDPWTS